MTKGIDNIGVSIVYFCHDGKGNFVMAKRSTNARDENGLWDIGGGALEIHDTVEKTLKKEIFEEYCTQIIAYDFLGFRDVHREHNNIRSHWIALDFKVLVDKNLVKNGEPHKFDEIAWFHLDSLPNNLHSQLNVFFEKYKDELK